MSDSPIPTDQFSTELRKAHDNPGALGASSTVRTRDDYGNTATFVIETYRVVGKTGARETVFLEINRADGGTRLVLPPEVTATLTRQHEQLTTRSRKRAAKRSVENRRALGLPVGNPDALRNARKRRSKKGGAR